MSTRGKYVKTEGQKLINIITQIIEDYSLKLGTLANKQSARYQTVGGRKKQTQKRHRTK